MVGSLMLGSTSMTASTSSSETLSSTIALPRASSTERRLSTSPSMAAFFAPDSTARRLALVWGLEPRLSREPASLEEVTDDAVEKSVEFGLAEPGQRLLILAGTPFGAPGAANLLRLAHVPMKAKR